jgi:hypothetical protein
MALIPPQGQAQSSPESKPVVKAGWMATGESSVAAAEQDKAEYERRKEEQGKAFRFWLEPGEEARITFVDGQLFETKAGMVLLPARYHEHNLFLNGRWGHHFVCPEKTAPGQGFKCPICESGDRPTLVALFTIIDHREFKGKNDKVYKDDPKLLVLNPMAFEQLNALAQKIGGLAGSTWDVSRVGEKSPRTGNNFFPQGKTPLDELYKKYLVEQKDPKTNLSTWVSKFKVLDYEQEIIFRTDDQLRAMGLGKPTTQVSGFGPQAATSPVQTAPQAAQDYSQHL